MQLCVGGDIFLFFPVILFAQFNKNRAIFVSLSLFLCVIHYSCKLIKYSANIQSPQRYQDRYRDWLTEIGCRVCDVTDTAQKDGRQGLGGRCVFYRHLDSEDDAHRRQNPTRCVALHRLRVTASCRQDRRGKCGKEADRPALTGAGRLTDKMKNRRRVSRLCCWTNS